MTRLGPTEVLLLTACGKLNQSVPALETTSAASVASGRFVNADAEGRGRRCVGGARGPCGLNEKRARNPRVPAAALESIASRDCGKPRLALLPA